MVRLQNAVFTFLLCVFLGFACTLLYLVNHRMTRMMKFDTEMLVGFVQSNLGFDELADKFGYLSGVYHCV